MALPALAWLGAHGSVAVMGPAWLPTLTRDLDLEAVARLEGDVAVLLKPAFRAAWEARSVPVRVGVPGDLRGPLLTHVVRPEAEHRVQGFLRVASHALRAAGLPEVTWAIGPPRWPAWRVADGPPLAPWPERAVLVLPGTKSPATVRWPGLGALVRALGSRAVVAGGPGDEAAVAEVAPGLAQAWAPLDLDALGRLACRAQAVVALDSGLGHLAVAARRAAGVDPAAVHVVYGSTDPAQTGPFGATPHHGTRPRCWPCYRKGCAIGVPCLDLSVATLLEALA